MERGKNWRKKKRMRLYTHTHTHVSALKILYIIQLGGQTIILESVGYRNSITLADHISNASVSQRRLMYCEFGQLHACWIFY